MSKIDANLIETHLKSTLKNKRIKIPRGIQFGGEGNAVELTLSPSAMGLGDKPLNMQNVAAAFEGWAIVLFVHFLNENGTVTLSGSIPEKAKTLFDWHHCHYNRFLYRVLKFREQFGSWFRLSPDIAEAVDTFQHFLAAQKFVNNIAGGEAGRNQHLENIVEGLLAGQKSDVLRKIAAEHNISPKNPIYRQLPTGLFKEEVHRETAIFTGSKSAIDLWTEQDQTIFIFELKVQNNMIGIITELFFYANYTYAMFCHRATSFCPLPSPASQRHRGYASLLSPEGAKNHDRVQAFFLSDRRHPLITPQVLRTLNSGTEIIYEWLDYRLEAVVEELAGAPAE